MSNPSEKRVCACGRKYLAQEWKTEKEKYMCTTCFVKEKFMKEVFGKLSHRDQFILKMRFGLEDGVSHTREEVGKRFGVTASRIAQIEGRAIELLSDYQKKVEQKEPTQ